MTPLLAPALPPLAGTTESKPAAGFCLAGAAPGNFQAASNLWEQGEDVCGELLQCKPALV